MSTRAKTTLADETDSDSVIHVGFTLIFKVSNASNHPNNWGLRVL